MKTTIYLTAAVLTLAAAPVFAQGWGGPLGMMGRYDSDNDGKISAAEFDAGRSADFTKMDANGDGKVTADEMTAYQQGMMANMGGGNGGGDPDRAKRRVDMFMQADKDGDGAVSADEYKAAGDARFKMEDANGDGFIDASEVAAMRGNH